MVTISMISAKMATLGPLKIKTFWNEGYDVITYVHDATNKILPCDANYTVDVQIALKFDTSLAKGQKVLGANSYVWRSYLTLEMKQFWIT